MSTVQDIVERCQGLTVKYGLGPAHTRDLIELAQFVITHCQERIIHPLEAE